MTKDEELADARAWMADARKALATIRPELYLTYQTASGRVRAPTPHAAWVDRLIETCPVPPEDET